ncbi:MAG: PSD1 and planctomycete cytochrome C domain-containing protein [Aureliella sp.]
MKPLRLLCCWVCCWGLVSLSMAEKARAQKDAKSAQQAQVKFFEAKIRPALVKHCYECHSAESSELGGGLQLDSRDGLLAGGDSGPAVVPGKPKASLLLKAIQQTDRDLVMPPKEAGGKLSDETIADFETWIRNGAVDPRTEAAAVAKKKYDPEASKDWWAWQPRQHVAPPQVQNEKWVREPIDRFILAGLEREGMKPSADADRVTLVRRLAFDLTGLPPSVSELYDYALSPSPLPLESLIDRYLDSPRYGERMGRHWLDVARYAESTGKDFNATFPHAWRYRDYVIDAFNEDMSYRNFIMEQIAGDLLPSQSASAKTRHTIATGFLALGPKGLNEANPRQFATDLADEQIDTVSQAFLGVTLACARCHDHKFDPITQRDYTAVAGIFLSTETRFGSQGNNNGRNRGKLAELPRGFLDEQAYSRALSPLEYKRLQERVEQLEQERRTTALAARERPSTDAKNNPRRELNRIQNQLAALETELSLYNEDGSLKALAMAAADKPAAVPRPVFAPRARRALEALANVQRRGGLPLELQTIHDSPLYERGEVDRPGERVPRGLPAFFARGKQVDIPDNTSGRMELARWIADEENTLTARVMVNRVWSWMMGRGLVASVDNFGSTGEAPSHPELLDYLAGEFVRNNWSVKKLVRTIALSRTYAMASDYDEANYARDPDNRNYWRANPRTLEAEAVRDTLLSAAGTLDLARPHGSLISKAGDGILGRPRPNPRGRGVTEEDITKIDADYRSVYLPVPRDLLPDVLELFDYPDNSLVHGSRDSTLVPSQSLFWMNSKTVERAVKKIAQRVLGSELAAQGDESEAKGKGGDKAKDKAKDKADGKKEKERSQYGQASKVDVAAKFNDICLLTLSRPPLPEETAAAERFVAEQTQLGASDETIWMSVCRAVISSADFRRLR